MTLGPTEPTYSWLEQWMAEYDISSISDYRSAIRSPTAVKALYSSMTAVKHRTELPEDVSAASVLAGRSLDISGVFTRSCAACMRSELETVITRTSHYFDRVVVGGPPADKFSLELGDSSKESRRAALNDLGAHVQLTLYINQIGARDRISYAEKPTHICPDCSKNIGLQNGFGFYDNEDQLEQIMIQIVNESKIHFMRNRSGAWTATVQHPLFHGNGEWGYEFGRTRPTRKKVAEKLFPVLTDPYVHDYHLANHYRLPLVNIHQASWLDSRTTEGQGFSAEQAALHFDLPTINGLELQDLISFQNDHREHYIKFQAAVRSAVREFLGRQELDSPQATARAVVDEVIKPELASIDAQLKAAMRSLSTKVAASAFVSSTVASAGLIASMPLMIATGVAAASTSLVQLYKYVDDRSSIQSSDMYYLWKLDKVGHH